MKDKIENPPAFPVREHLDYNFGMTLLDYFAAKAMEGLISNGKREPNAYMAKKSYEIAYAMLKERAKNL